MEIVVRYVLLLSEQSLILVFYLIASSESPRFAPFVNDGAASHLYPSDR
jgi:hypothetical protein